MSASLTILAFFTLGLLLGAFNLLPDFLSAHDPTLPALWLLMFLVGLSIGREKKLIAIFRSLHPKIILLPLATTGGTFAGAAFAALFVAWSLAECLAIGAGFGYYSLSSVFISQYKGPEAGTVALLANIIREIFTLLFAIPVCRLAGPAAAIACGGCTTMDTTLPILTRAAGQQWILPCILHAMVLDFSVPFWVTLFCSI